MITYHTQLVEKTPAIKGLQFTSKLEVSKPALEKVGQLEQEIKKIHADYETKIAQCDVKYQQLKDLFYDLNQERMAENTELLKQLSELQVDILIWLTFAELPGA